MSVETLDHLRMIKHAISVQANDFSLWCDGVSIGEAYLQQALRDLHRVIEDKDKEALARIEDCAGCSSHEREESTR